MKKPTTYLLLFLIMFSVCCKRSILIPKDIKGVLERAGDNKDELEKVINHYSADIKDSLKLKAAFFLIFNIEGLKTLDTSSLQANQIYFDNLNAAYVKNHKKNDFSTICLVIDSINKENKLNPEKIQVSYTDEIKVVSSDFLISNIDLAFNAWEIMPWAKKLSFKDFCEYVLPYRCTDTYSVDARKYFFERYKTLPDSTKNTDDPAKVADYIVKDIDSWFNEDPNIPTKYPYLNPVSFSDLMKGKVGNCVSANSVKVTALRSLGIPAVLDELPNWGNSNSSHYWFKVISPSKDKNPSLLTNKNDIEDTQNIISGSSYDILPEFGGVPEKVQLYYKRTVAKVYRNSFSKPSDNLEHLKDDGDEIPQYFKNDRLMDITNKYVECADLRIKLNNILPDQKFAYLCVYDNYKWHPVSKTQIMIKEAIFKDMGKNIVYLPGYYNNGNIVPAGEPFILNLKGNKVNLMPKKQSEAVTLYTKYPYRIFVHFWQSSMIGGQFQFANSPDLSDSVTVFKVNKIPFYQTEVNLRQPTKYRFLFFKFRDKLPQTIFSKIQFFGINNLGKEVKLSGKLIGNPGVYPDIKGNIATEDRNSYMITKEKAERYVGIDLGAGNATKITKIVYIPRDDDNGVVSGDIYELFYWEDKWVSLGYATGNKFKQVTFENIPLNALLLMKNTKGGTENRIFTYHNGRQFFW